MCKSSYGCPMRLQNSLNDCTISTRSITYKLMSGLVNSGNKKTYAPQYLAQALIQGLWLIAILKTLLRAAKHFQGTLPAFMIS